MINAVGREIPDEILKMRRNQLLQERIPQKKM